MRNIARVREAPCDLPGGVDADSGAAANRFLGISGCKCPVWSPQEAVKHTGRFVYKIAHNGARRVNTVGADVPEKGACVWRIERDECPVGRPQEAVVAGTFAARCVNPGDFPRRSNAFGKCTRVCVSRGIVSVLQLRRSIEGDECAVPHSQEGVLPATTTRGIGPKLAPKARVLIPPCYHACLVYARGLNARRHARWFIRRAHRAIKSDIRAIGIANETVAACIERGAKS